MSMESIKEELLRNQRISAKKMNEANRIHDELLLIEPSSSHAAQELSEEAKFYEGKWTAYGEILAILEEKK